MAVIGGHPSEAAERQEDGDNDAVGQDRAAMPQQHLETLDDRLNISWSQDPLTTNRRVRQRRRLDGTSKDDCLPDDFNVWHGQCHEHREEPTPMAAVMIRYGASSV